MTSSFMGTVNDDNIDDLIGSFGALSGLQGNDVLQGGSQGGVILDGGPGFDYLDSYGYRDRLIGGSDRDVFDVFAGKNPTIVDFSAGEQDLLVVNIAALADGVIEASGLTAISPSRLKTVKKKGKVKVRPGDYMFDPVRGTLSFDADGKGGDSPIPLATFEGAIPTRNQLLSQVFLFDGDQGSPAAQAYFDTYRF